jgi:hypothetical protein
MCFRETSLQDSIPVLQFLWLQGIFTHYMTLCHILQMNTGLLPQAEPYVLSEPQTSTSALTFVDPSADQVKAPFLLGLTHETHLIIQWSSKITVNGLWNEQSGIIFHPITKTSFSFMSWTRSSTITSPTTWLLSLSKWQYVAGNTLNLIQKLHNTCVSL